MENKALHQVSFGLLVIGGLNWGLVGLFDWDLVEVILGNWPWLMRLVYILVGIATIIILATHRRQCRLCQEMAPHRNMTGPTAGQSV